MSLQKQPSLKHPCTVLFLLLMTGSLWVSSFSMTAQAKGTGEEETLRQGLPGRRVSGGTRASGGT